MEFITNKLGLKKHGLLSFLPIFILVLAFLIIRLFILFTSISLIVGPEERVRGSIAMSLIKGLKMPLFEYQCDTYGGGSIIAGILAIPFFLLFGPSIASLKLVGLSFSTATLILWYFFCNKFFNRRLATIMSLLFIFSPIRLTRYSLATGGCHLETVFFNILVILIFFQIFFNGEKHKVNFIILGLISGFSLWFAYIFFITFLTCLLFWFILDRKLFIKKEFFIFIIFFIIGFSPWIYYNLTRNFIGLDVIKLYFTIPGKMIEPFRIINNFKSLIFHKLFYFLAFTISIREKSIISILYYLIFISSFCCLLWWNRKIIKKIFLSFIPFIGIKLKNEDISIELFFLIYFIISFFIYSIFNYSWVLDDGTRYFVPLFPLIILIITLFLDRIRESRPLVSFLIICFLLLAGFFGNLKLIGFDRSFGIGFNINGYYDRSK